MKIRGILSTGFLQRLKISESFNFCKLKIWKRDLGEKKGIVSEYLPWLLIALAVLAIIIISIIIMKEKGISIIDQIKNIFKYR